MTSTNKFNSFKVDSSGAGKMARHELSINNNQDDTDEEEQEIEANKLEKSSEHAINEEEDSDEEFFVHQALLPLRKSKTSEFATTCALVTEKSPNLQVESLMEMQKSFKFASSTLQYSAQAIERSKEENLGILETTNNSSSTSCTNTGSSSPVLQGCWSAPPAFSDCDSVCSSKLSSRYNSSEDFVENECADSQLKHSLFFLDEEPKEKKESEHRKRSFTSWSSPSRLFTKCKTKSRRMSVENGRNRGTEELFAEELAVDNVEEKAIYEKQEMCDKIEEEKMSTSSEDEGSEDMFSSSSSSENETTLESAREQARGISQSSSFKSSSRRIFIAPEYSGSSQPPPHCYTNSSIFPSSKSDSQLIWYHAPVTRVLSRPRTPKFNESLNSFDKDDTDNPEIESRHPLPHSATYCFGSGVMPRYHKDVSRNEVVMAKTPETSTIAAASHRLSMPLPFSQFKKNGLTEEEELYSSEDECLESVQAGYSMASHKWETKWKKYAEKKNESNQPPSSSPINYRQPVGSGISMKKKRSSFALDEAVGATIPMADDLTVIHTSRPECPQQVYNRSSSPCSSSTSEYDNYYSDGAREETGKAEKWAKNRYISRRSPPLACADDLLSDSEISELEKKVARGDFSGTITYDKDKSSVEAGDLIETAATQNGGPSTHLRANVETTLCQPAANNISGSASMPCFSSTAIQTEQQQNIWLDCDQEEEKALEKHVIHPTTMIRSATMTTQNPNCCRPTKQFESQWSIQWPPQQRRILPLRPDEVVGEKRQIASSQPQQLAAEQQAKTKPSRRLPQIPPQTFCTTQFAAEVDSLGELQLPIQTNNSQKTALVKSRASLSLLQRPLTMTTLQEDLTTPETLQPQKAENTAQTPMLVSYSTLAKLLPQQAYSHPITAHCPDKREYQLSYGAESLMSSTTTAPAEHSRRQHATNKYGIMEDSYYEDGLNGNNPVEDRDVSANTHRHLNEENRKNSGYYLAEENSSGISSCCTSSSTNADHPTNGGVAGIDGKAAPKKKSGPTHRVQFPFSPRHPEEIALEVGDAVKVERECEDHWCYGTNLRTTQHGIFPVAHICEIDLVEEICQGILQANAQVPIKQERDTFYLTMLASVEVGHHKGNDVLVQAINKVCSVYQLKDEILIPQTVLMEVSFRGIHVIDKRRKDMTLRQLTNQIVAYFCGFNLSGKLPESCRQESGQKHNATNTILNQELGFFRCPTFDFFFSLQNISFCGAHPKQLRYFGFITKHPLLPRFACHVFLSQESTQPIVEAIGRAFKRSYDEYMAFAHPTEDIFIE